MTTGFFLSLLLMSISNGEISPNETISIPAFYCSCLDYYDGCNHCLCDVEDGGSTSCTAMGCEPPGTAMCQECREETYYFSGSSYCESGSVSTCDDSNIVYVVAPCSIGETKYNYSYCDCPSTHPYWTETINGDIGCVKLEDCPNYDQDEYILDILPDDIFIYPTSISSECSYEYTLCTEYVECDDGLSCYIPESNYAECIPLFCNLDNECNLIMDDNCMTNDCMGHGYGYCVDDMQQESRCQVHNILIAILIAIIVTIL